MADLENRDIFQSYISKVFVNVNTTNDDVVKITTKKFSPSGDIYELDTRAISPSVIQTEKSLEELEPEVSDVYPFKVVPPQERDGSVIIYSPTNDTEVTASQNYYVPTYFERYNIEVIRELDKEFTELTIEEINELGVVFDEEEQPIAEPVELQRLIDSLTEELERITQENN
jgi:hypothetical protein